MRTRVMKKKLSLNAKAMQKPSENMIWSRFVYKVVRNKLYMSVLLENVINKIIKKTKFDEGYKEDQTIEGSGEKLMHLL